MEDTTKSTATDATQLAETKNKRQRRQTKAGPKHQAKQPSQKAARTKPKGAAPAGVDNAVASPVFSPSSELNDIPTNQTSARKTQKGASSTTRKRKAPSSTRIDRPRAKAPKISAGATTMTPVPSRSTTSIVRLPPLDAETLSTAMVAAARTADDMIDSFDVLLPLSLPDESLRITAPTTTPQFSYSRAYGKDFLAYHIEDSNDDDIATSNKGPVVGADHSLPTMGVAIRVTSVTAPGLHQHLPGVGIAGRVEAVSPELVDQFETGQEVLACVLAGGDSDAGRVEEADRITVSGKLVWAKPPHITVETAAQMALLISPALVKMIREAIGSEEEVAGQEEADTQVRVTKSAWEMMVQVDGVLKDVRIDFPPDGIVER